MCVLSFWQQQARARFHTHTEFCRSRIYDCLKAEGSLTIRVANSERTATRTAAGSKEQERDSSVHGNANVPDAGGAEVGRDISKLDPEDFGGDVVEHSCEALVGPPDDETEFYSVVNDDRDMVENAQAMEDEYHAMLSLIDTLLCLGVAAEVASSFSASICRNKSRFQSIHRDLGMQAGLIGSLTGKLQTFM